MGTIQGVSWGIEAPLDFIFLAYLGTYHSEEGAQQGISFFLARGTRDMSALGLCTPPGPHSTRCRRAWRESRDRCGISIELVVLRRAPNKKDPLWGLHKGLLVALWELCLSPRWAPWHGVNAGQRERGEHRCLREGWRGVPAVTQPCHHRSFSSPREAFLSIISSDKQEIVPQPGRLK